MQKVSERMEWTFLFAFSSDLFEKFQICLDLLIQICSSSNDLSLKSV